VDLSEIAGRRPWVLIVFKISLWLLLGLVALGMITSFFRGLKSGSGQYFISLIIILCLLVSGFWFVISLLPKAVGQVIRRFVRRVLGLSYLAIRWVVNKIWNLMK
jgi:hypothetical protein